MARQEAGKTVSKRGKHPDAPKPVNSDLAAHVAEKIRELIVRGELAPQVQLRQENLARQFSVSRIPVREALKLLVAETIIVHDLNRGFFVASLSSDEAEQLYRMRHLIERELLATLAWPNAAELRHLRQTLDEIEALVDHGLRRDWTSRHGDFHRAIIGLSKKKFLVREAERLWTLTDRYRSLLPVPAGRSDAKARLIHRRRLLEALARHNRNQVIAVFEAGRNEAEEQVVRILEGRGL